MVRAAGIDIGTNSFRLLIADLGPGKFVPSCKELNTVRLGEGLGADHLLQPGAIERGIAALAQFAGMIDHYQPRYIRACGTHALRLAANRDLFLARAHSALGFAVEVVDGAEEAALSLRGALFTGKGALEPPLLLVDVGGGSTEMIWLAEHGAPPMIRSLPIGAVNLTEAFAEIAPESLALAAMAGHVRARLKEGLTDLALPAAGCRVVGSGGTATSLGALDLGLAVYDENLVQNHVLGQGRLENIFAVLTALSSEQRLALPGLGEGRGRIIVAGAVIYRELLQLLACDEIVVSDGGLLEGILLSSLPSAAGL
ncbi:MAG: hypothetical protein OEY01_04165 [Desulfobulbaceae bacterium]|nr:hypothetical protein [Desulfobulbaceae bacterium]HIJ78379.1 exopolyphosphatase [Deltaproteobacteria bacterium]